MCLAELIVAVGWLAKLFKSGDLGNGRLRYPWEKILCTMFLLLGILFIFYHRQLRRT